LGIEDWRIEIDRIDEQLIELLNRRSQCAIEIGRIKRGLGLPVYSPSREKEVIENVTHLNSGPLDPEAVRRLFERIIDESRRIERIVVEREAEEERNGSKNRPGGKPVNRAKRKRQVN
jgi:chorismate mutase